ncbi:hypothetical protein [Brevundimonas sp. M20]|uniref:hypothetical protein n=1 Tax=Brevundimonas sp. M20 TaxID=2591463 RepID=UPI0011464406|nr:hypothetical protein [Brevundimonas sp. M20]QDH73381.1 hypothetical protein FKQ52_08040 [Brevundimonas sp. M20]
MTCDLALDDTPLPDMEEVYRLAAARVTDAVQRGKIELALRWGRILNLALRDRQMRARLPVTADEVNQRLDPARETPAGRASPPSHQLHSSHPVFDAPPPEPVPGPNPPRPRLRKRRRRR